VSIYSLGIRAITYKRQPSAPTTYSAEGLVEQYWHNETPIESRIDPNNDSLGMMGAYLNLEDAIVNDDLDDSLLVASTSSQELESIYFEGLLSRNGQGKDLSESLNVYRSSQLNASLSEATGSSIDDGKYLCPTCYKGCQTKATLEYELFFNQKCLDLLTLYLENI
jgi:hypothetical protein